MSTHSLWLCLFLFQKRNPRLTEAPAHLAGSNRGGLEPWSCDSRTYFHVSQTLRREKGVLSPFNSTGQELALMQQCSVNFPASFKLTAIWPAQLCECCKLRISQASSVPWPRTQDWKSSADRPSLPWLHSRSAEWIWVRYLTLGLSIPLHVTRHSDLQVESHDHHTSRSQDSQVSISLVRKLRPGAGKHSRPAREQPSQDETLTLALSPKAGALKSSG